MAEQLKSSKVDFGAVTRSQRRIERIACANAGVVPLRLSALIKPEYVTLRTEPEVLQPGEEGDILVIVDAELIKTVGEQRFRVLVEGIKGTPSVRTIEGRLYISDDKE